MRDLLGPATRENPPTRITLHVPIITDHLVFSKFLKDKMLLKVFSVKLGAQASCLQKILQPLVQAGSLRSRVTDVQNMPPTGKNYENSYNGRVYFLRMKYWDCLSESERVSDSGGKTTAGRMNQGGWKDR